MRISNNSLYINYEKNLGDIQARKFNDGLKLTTGKDLNSLADDPRKIVSIKNVANKISRNEAYLATMSSAVSEMQLTDEQLNSIYEKLTKIRELSINAANVASSDSLKSLGVYVKGMLEDLVKDANADFDGHYLFSGTKTTDESMPPTPPEKNSQPFELVQDTPTATNPSGLRVVFKGNDKDRTIDKDKSSTEVINIKAGEIFGGSGNEIFGTIIDLYNLITYNSDGTERGAGDGLTRDDTGILDELQKKIADQAYVVTNAAGVNGARMNRLTALTDQLNYENVRLNDIRSADEDTDYAKTSMDLARDDMALQYTLQVGARLSQVTLFDFLS